MEYEFGKQEETGPRLLEPYEIDEVKSALSDVSESVDFATSALRRRYLAHRLGFLFSDVSLKQLILLEERMRRLAMAIEGFSENGKAIPSIKLGKQREIPVDIIGSFRRKNDEYIPTRIEVEQKAVECGLIPATMDVEEARRTVVEGATTEIVDSVNINRDPTREAGGNYAGYRSGVVPGLSITVHTKHDKVPVLYSTASFMTYNQRFGGSLSSPVSSYLDPGRYIFGVNLASGALYDTAENRIPPNLTIFTATA
ncbi:MAG: hypothetical protein AAFQ58_23580 [Pseudomonadota bacterium]